MERAIDMLLQDLQNEPALGLNAVPGKCPVFVVGSALPCGENVLDNSFLESVGNGGTAIRGEKMTKNVMT